MLRFKLKFFAQSHVYAFGLEQLKQLGLVFQVGASGVAEAETRALIALMEEFGQRGVLAGDA